jgi:hypothetical protein
LLGISIRIKRNLNIVACTKTSFNRSVYGDISVKLKLEYNKVSRSNRLAWLLLIALITVYIYSPYFFCRRILSQPSTKFRLRYIVLLLSRIRSLGLGSS